jgi:hypothetical protein
MNPTRRKLFGCLSAACVALTTVALAASSVSAQKLPIPDLQEVLIKTMLMTFNDANLTGNYEVLHARMSKPFRDKFSVQQLSDGFKVFRDQKTNLGPIVVKQPIPTEPARIEKGVLKLYGYFDTSPSRVYYFLEFIVSDESGWRATRIEVHVKPVKEPG